MIYSVAISETLERSINIEAVTADEALEKVKGLYRESEIVLDSGDFTDVAFSIKGSCCEGHGMKLEVLNDINNQCSIVQKTIAENFGSNNNEDLPRELLTLHKLLEKYLDV